MDAKLDAERARLVRALRTLADRIERLPLDRASEALGLLAASIDTLVGWVDKVIGGGRGAGGERGRRQGD
jgi:hypothetical protein